MGGAAATLSSLVRKRRPFSSLPFLKKGGETVFTEEDLEKEGGCASNLFADLAERK